MLLTSVMVAAATTQYSPPRARNYGFADIGTHDECKYVSDILDGASYDSRYLYSNPAHYAYNNMYQNAIYTFDGHGLEDANGNLGLGEYFYNTYTSSYPTKTYFSNKSGTNSNSTVYLNNLASASFSEMLLAVNVGCGTAATHSSYGNFTKKMKDKGCNAAVGFYAKIGPAQADYWYKRFFVHANNGYSFSDSAYKAIVDTKNYTGSYAGIDSCMLYGTGTLKLKPARYGN